MHFHQLLDEDRAVSPVIGVILMVAITVILAAVIGTFVLGLGDQVQDTTPRAQFGFDQGTEKISTTGGNPDSSVTALTISHETGDTISGSNLAVTVNGARALSENETQEDIVDETFSRSVSAGSSTTIIAATSDESISTDGNYAFIYDAGTDKVDIRVSGSITYVAQGVGLSSGDTVRVVWSAGDDSATLATHELQ